MALAEPRRTATAAALFSTLEAAALDDAVELFDALASDIVSALPTTPIAKRACGRCATSTRRP